MRPNPKTNESLDEDSTEPADWLIRANQGHSIKLESEALLRPIMLEPDKNVDKLATEASKTVLQDTPAATTTSSTAAITTVPKVLLSSVPVPPVVVHGTYFAFWSSIVASGGLRPMSRTHVHFATGVPEDKGPDTKVISGMRRDAELLIYIDVEQSLRDGAMSWWMSENGVVLTEGVRNSDSADVGPEKGLVPLRYFKEVVGRKASGNGQVGVLWRDGVKVADLPEGLKFSVPQGKGGRGGGRGGQRGGRARGRGGGGAEG
jgi:2'-phosphotransferase